MSCGFKIEYIYKPNFCPSCGAGLSARAVAAKPVAPTPVRRIEEDEEEDDDTDGGGDYDFSNLSPLEVQLDVPKATPLVFGQIARNQKINEAPRVVKANKQLLKSNLSKVVDRVKTSQHIEIGTSE